jgi:hypothetical protein
MKGKAMSYAQIREATATAAVDAGLTGEQYKGLILAFTFWRLTIPTLKPENSALMARNDVRQPGQSFDRSGRNVC